MIYTIQTANFQLTSVLQSGSSVNKMNSGHPDNTCPGAVACMTKLTAKEGVIMACHLALWRFNILKQCQTFTSSLTVGHRRPLLLSYSCKFIFLWIVRIVWEHRHWQATRCAVVFTSWTPQILVARAKNATITLTAPLSAIKLFCNNIPIHDLTSMFVGHAPSQNGYHWFIVFVKQVKLICIGPFDRTHATAAAASNAPDK